MKTLLLSTACALLLCINFAFSSEITPYKATDAEVEKGFAPYAIPAQCRFTIPRHVSSAPEIVYYFSRPSAPSYPIVFFCTGSSSKGRVHSVIHLHRYFLEEILELQCGLMTVEQWGAENPEEIDEATFFAHYTRTQRLQDHVTVIDGLTQNPPAGWNGKLVFIGVSEGGLLVTALTELYQDLTIATVNWSGSGDWSWRDELWAFIENLRKNGPAFLRFSDKLPAWVPFIPHLPKNRSEYDLLMDSIAQEPTSKKECMGMTYLYHADAMAFPKSDYQRICTPFLVVTGALDSIVASSRQFVQKAQNVGAPITYWEVPGMDHYVRKRVDILDQSFDWLRCQLNK